MSDRQVDVRFKSQHNVEDGWYIYRQTSMFEMELISDERMELTLHSLHANILDSSKVYCAKELHIFEDVYSGTKQEDLISCLSYFFECTHTGVNDCILSQIQTRSHTCNHIAGRVYDT